jgi:hypothetical protein
MQNCPTGSYALNSSYSCNTCPPGCAVCTSYYQCTQCKINYTLINGICSKNQTCPANCQLCADTNNCIICNNNYYTVYNSLGKFCINVCPIGTYKNNDQCSVCPL